MAANGSISGKAGFFKIGSTEYPITNWTIEPSAEELDATNTKSNGNRQVTDGIHSANGTIEFQYDPTDNAISSMGPGTNLDNVNLFFNDAKGFSNVELMVTSMPLASPVDGMVTGTFNFSSNGYDFTGDLSNL